MVTQRTCVQSPHVLIADDFDNRTGNLLAILVDSLQERLQPSHVTFDVGVEEGKNLAYGAESKHPAAVKQTVVFAL